jgi:hypothetical protein
MAAADAAVRRLIRGGAAIAFISMDGAYSELAAERSGARAGFDTAVRVRTVPCFLELADSLEGTLASLGARTRRNLRYYRRRVASELGATFVPRVRMSRDEFLAFNQVSSHPFTTSFAAWRYSLVEQRSGRDVLFAGLRDKQGRWLSIVGGRHDHDCATIDWQMNRADMPRFSLSTAMRAFLLEYEIERGAARLYFEGGTPHSMRFAFDSSETTDILAMRTGSIRSRLLRRFADHVLPKNNFLRAALNDEAMLAR